MGSRDRNRVGIRNPKQDWLLEPGAGLGSGDSSRVGIKKPGQGWVQETGAELGSGDRSRDGFRRPEQGWDQETKVKNPVLKSEEKTPGYLNNKVNKYQDLTKRNFFIKCKTGFILRTKTYHCLNQSYPSW